MITKLFKTIWAFFATRYEIVPSVAEEQVVVALTMAEEVPKYLWDTPEQARHSVRVICDEEGLSVKAKNIVCAVIGAESGWKNTAKNENKNRKGIVISTDWGICQINDHYHVGDGLAFKSVQYILDNPEMCVRWMCKMYKAGLIKLWCAYTNGSYKKFLNK